MKVGHYLLAKQIKFPFPEDGYKRQAEDSWNMEDKEIKTGLDKLGAILGEESRIGGSVMLSPGTVIGMKTFIATGLVVGGYVPANKFMKVRTQIEITENKFTGSLHNKSKLYG